MRAYNTMVMKCNILIQFFSFAAAFVHFVFFILGLIFMGIYYSLLHPNVINSHIVPHNEQQEQRTEVPTHTVVGPKVDL